MLRYLFTILLGIIVLANAQSPSSIIKHIVVLMMENRSFDHILGFLKSLYPNIDGCLPDANPVGGKCSNPWDPSDPQSAWYTVTRNQGEHSFADPHHDNADTGYQVFGYGPNTSVPAPMTGFIKNYNTKYNGSAIMDCLDPPSMTPALATLAEQFAMFDGYFSSVPGPTEVNRLFGMSATSDGSANNDDGRLALGYPQRTIFNNIDDSSYETDWACYFQDFPTAAFLDYPRRHPTKLHLWDQFLKDAAAGTLPSFSWLDPQYLDTEVRPAHDQHPNHDIGLGDQLIKQTYEALRNGPLWNETLLLITYDEHGGWFDHVSPPSQDVPNPDGKSSHDSDPPFYFNRLGVRVPMVAVSPWISKGLVINQQGTDGTNAYEHSSISATVRSLLVPDQPFLTKRDAWAADMSWLVTTEKAPRTDCPTTLPTAPTTTHAPHQVKAQAHDEVHDFQWSILVAASGLGGRQSESWFRELREQESWTEQQGADFVAEKLGSYFRKAKARPAVQA